MEPELSNIQPISIKKTLLIVNHFILNTTNFINKFAIVCEQKLGQVNAVCISLCFPLSIFFRFP